MTERVNAGTLLKRVWDHQKTIRISLAVIQSTLGYGKLADWVYDSSDATLAATGRSHVGYPDDTVGLYDKHSRGLAIRDAAHAVDLDWRPIRFRQNILALFHIPASGPYRAAKLHEHQDSGFDDNETIGIIEGYGKLRGSDDESFPCPLQTSQHGQIGAEIVAGGCLDVAVTELSCDH